MFRRRWSGLPDDPDFPADLGKLGYHINDIDEIRSTADPKFYFNYFMSKNVRHNDRHRFAFTLAVQDIIHARLEALHLVKVALPLTTTTTTTTDTDTDTDAVAASSPEGPHSPIFVSDNLSATKRVVVVFGEREQDLGVLAHRVVGGQGGVEEGSMVSIVRILQAQGGGVGGGGVGGAGGGAGGGGGGGEDTGVVLANTGETWWWPEGGRPLCYRQSMGVPMRSSVMLGRWFDPNVNGIPGNGDMDEHVKCVFESILDNDHFVHPDATIQLIALSDGAVAVEKYLDANWENWKDRIGCLAMLGGGQSVDELTSDGFKEFLVEKARAYITSTADLGTPMADAGGNPDTVYFTAYGCPVFSSGEPYYIERTFIKAKGIVLPWMEEVYKAGQSYVNPEMKVTFRDETVEDVPAWSSTPWPVTDAPRRSQCVQPAQGDVEDEGQVEIITKEEWEARQEAAEDKGEKADPSKVVVL